MPQRGTAASVLLATTLICSAGVRAPALARAPVCATARTPAAITIHGTMTEENSTGTFERTIDLRSGFSRTVRNNGVQRSLSGFNGTEWTYTNGIPSVIDVPVLMPNGVARAFVSRLGWNDPAVRPSRVARAGATLERTYDLPHMSRVTVVSGSDSLRPSRVMVDADWGIERTTFSDWRCVHDMNYPFTQTQTEGTGETHTIRVSRVDTTHGTPGAFDVPQAQPHGHVTQSPPVEFRYAGKRDRHIVVDATIGGATVPLILDTGAANYVGPQAAQRLGLSVSGGLTLTGVGSGSIAGGFARIPAMTVGNAVLDDEVAIVGPLPWPESATAPAGLTGFEFFAEFRTTIDYPNRTIAFSDFADPPAVDGVRVPLRTINHFPVVEATVNGIPGWFGVDTGDGAGITLFKHFADGAGIRPDPALQQTTGRGVGGTSHFTQSRLRAFSIGTVSIAQPRVLMSDATAGAFASRSLAGNLGSALFSCFRLTLDYRRRELLLFSVPSTEACLQELAADRK
jgi:hypothetical protein